MECTVKLEIFEGPMDLLLHLIKKNEIDIYDIPVALITRQYLEYLGWMQALNLDIASEYLVMAATLIHIKSRMLLPAHPESEEDSEELEEDPRAELVRRLLEYQRYKEAGQQLAQREILERDVFPRPRDEHAADDGGQALAPLQEVSFFQLLEAFAAVMAARRWGDLSLQVDLERVSLADRIREISEALERSPAGLSFEQLFPEGSGRRDLVTTFLALLEMIRLCMLRAYQASPYGTILLAAVAAGAAGMGPPAEAE